jgi:hypothetical protein
VTTTLMLRTHTRCIQHRGHAGNKVRNIRCPPSVLTRGNLKGSDQALTWILLRAGGLSSWPSLMSSLAGMDRGTQLPGIVPGHALPSGLSFSLHSSRQLRQSRPMTPRPSDLGRTGIRRYAASPSSPARFSRVALDSQPNESVAIPD